MNKETAAELLSKSLKDIFAFSVSRVYNKQDAEDLTSDIMIEVLSSVHRLEEDARFYGFLWKIAENTFKRYIRNKSMGNVEFNEAFFGAYWDTPEDRFLDHEEVLILRRELTLLSKQYREVTVSYYVQNKTVSEIAKELDISEEMVKYYLFKTRKILKEGINMERKLGEKSYNPSKFGIDFWGSGNNGYIWQIFERKLPGNIVLAAYDKPISIEDLSLELGVSAAYLEDELAILLKHHFIKEVGNKYQTDFLIFREPYEKEFQEKVPSAHFCTETIQNISEFVDSLLPKFRKRDFGVKLDDNKLKWFMVNFALINALGDFEERTQKQFGAYPRLNATTQGFVFGYDNHYDNSYFSGIYGRCDNKERTAYFSAVNYNIIKSCQWWQVCTVERSTGMCDAVLKKEVALTDEETIAQLVSEGMVTITEGMVKANFPVFTSRDNYYMRKELQPIIDMTVNAMDNICRMAAELFKKHTPKNLMDRCEHLCYVRHQMDVMGIIVEALVQTGYLTIPAEKTNLCVFGVKRES